jgi:hypothetical protein
MFETLHRFALGADKEIRILQNAGRQYLDLRKFRTESGLKKYLPDGVCVGEEEVPSLVEFIRSPPQNGILKERILPPNGRRIVIRSDPTGMGLWCNKLDPLSKLSGIYLVAAERTQLQNLLDDVMMAFRFGVAPSAGKKRKQKKQVGSNDKPVDAAELDVDQLSSVDA